MDLQSRLEDLLALAAEIGLEVRREPLGGSGGGYCVMRGRKVLFIDTLADLETRYDKTLAALAQLPEVDSHYIRPDLREELDAHRHG